MVKGGGRKEDWCGMKKEQEKWTEQKGGAPYVETQKEGRKAADPLVSGVGKGKVPESHKVRRKLAGPGPLVQGLDHLSVLHVVEEKTEVT